jgi:hypothetical protein
MKNLRSPFISFTLALSLAFPSATLAANCNIALANITEADKATVTSRSDYWKSEVIKAHQENRKEGEVYALFNYAIENSAQFTLGPITVSALRSLNMKLEMQSLDEEYATRGKSFHLFSRVLNFLGVSHLVQDNIFGVRPPSLTNYKLQSLKSPVEDAFLTVGPLFYSLTKLFRKSSNKNERLALNSLRGALTPSSPLLEDLANLDGISKEEARDKLIKNLDLVGNNLSRKAPERSWVMGRVLLPWIAALAIVLSHGAPPSLYLSFEASRLLPYSHQPYTGKQYMNDVTSQVGDLKKGKLLIAFSNDLFAEIDFKASPPMAIPEFRKLDTGANVDQIRIARLSDLSFEDIGTYDNIIIFSHGLPDSLAMPGGFPKGHFPKLKKGANIIYFSCLLGQRGGKTPDDEEWIKFSKSILDGGKAIVSTQILWTPIDPDYAGRTLDLNTERRAILGDNLETVISEGSGLEQTAFGVFSGYWAFRDKYYFESKGIRVYDSEKDQVKFLPSVPN